MLTVVKDMAHLSHASLIIPSGHRITGRFVDLGRIKGSANNRQVICGLRSTLIFVVE